MAKVHIRKITRGTLCGLPNKRWASSQVTTTRNTIRATCKRCKQIADTQICVRG